MEHRWEARMAIDREVIVNSGSEGPFGARARNISVHGIMLDTGRTELVPGTVVGLVCVASSRTDRPLFRARAQVVHFDRGRAGLMWVSYHAHAAKSGAGDHAGHEHPPERLAGIGRGAKADVAM